MKIVEIGGAQKLLNMLEGAKDDRTLKEALKALAALSQSGHFFCASREQFICLYYVFVLPLSVKQFIYP